MKTRRAEQLLPGRSHHTELDGTRTRRKPLLSKRKKETEAKPTKRHMNKPRGSGINVPQPPVMHGGGGMMVGVQKREQTPQIEHE